MATYQLVFTRASGGQTANLADFPDDQTVIADAEGVLSEDVVCTAIPRRAPDGDGEILGAWDWNDGAPIWTPED